MNNRDCLVSVIIPTYGEPVYLERCIQSVVKQTFENWELIIVDDNNPDTDSRHKTERIVSVFEKSDLRVKYIRHDKNRNGAVARNTGFALAKGEYISLLDSDDEYMPNRLQKCFDVMCSAPDQIAGVYTGCEFRRRGRKYHVEKSVPSGNFLVETLACNFMFCTGSNIFVRKKVVDELDGFDPTFLRHQDYEFLVRVFGKYSLKGIPEVLVVKNNENFNAPNVEKLISIKEQYLDKYKTVIASLSKEDQNKIYFWNCISIAEIAMAQNKFNLANIYYNKAKTYGRLPLNTRIRRCVYPLYNIVKRIL